MGFPDNSVSKESACNAGDPSSIPGSGRSPGKWIDYPLQYSWASLMAQLVRICLQCGRPGFKPWVGKIPWRREGLPTPVFWSGEFHGLHSQSMGSQRVGHDCTTFNYIHPSQTRHLVTIDQKRYKASLVGLPGGSDDNLPAMRKRGFSSWVGKIPWRRERLPTPVFWSGEFHGLYSPWPKSRARLSNFHFLGMA